MRSGNKLTWEWESEGEIEGSQNRTISDKHRDSPEREIDSPHNGFFLRGFSETLSV
jgi:hypothetical protein